MLEQYSLSPLNKWPDFLLITAANNIEATWHFMANEDKPKATDAFLEVERELEARIPNDIIASRPR